MPKAVNTSWLGNSIDESLDAGRKTMIKVEHVSMVFNIANQKLNSLKEWFIAFTKHEIRFKEFRALDDISFELKEGDVFGLIGTNGSGKSTMLKIVAGVLEPTEGTVEVNGRISPLIELGAGFNMDLTARENVYLNGALLGYPKSFIDEHMDEIIEFAEIEEFMDMPLKNYSSGMVARIAFSIATVIVPQILICDEVLSVGDFMFQQKCERRITDIIKNYGVTVLIVSHNNAQIERLCNKALWIEKGHTRMMGTAQDVCHAYRVVGGREGSAESEERVIEMMNEQLDDYKKVSNELSGNNRYATNVRACRAYAKGRTRAILAPSDDIVTAMVATGLGGVENAVLLSTATGFLPGATINYLKKLRPEHILVMDSTGKMSKDVMDSLDELIAAFEDWFPQVETMMTDGKSELSLAAYEYGVEYGEEAKAAAEAQAIAEAEAAATGAAEAVGTSEGEPVATASIDSDADADSDDTDSSDDADVDDDADADADGETPASTGQSGSAAPEASAAPAPIGWGDTCVLAYDYGETGLISLTPFISGEHAPVFFLTPDGDLDDKERAKEIAAVNEKVVDTVIGNFENVVILEQGFLVDDAIVEKIEKAGLGIVRFTDDDVCEINKEVDRWILSRREEQGAPKPDRFVVSTVWEPIDAYFVGPFAAAKNALILFANPNNLDESARNFDFFEELDGDIDHLTFVGGKSRFSQDDRIITAKAMMHARRKVGKDVPDPATEQKEED